MIFSRDLQVQLGNLDLLVLLADGWGFYLNCHIYPPYGFLWILHLQPWTFQVCLSLWFELILIVNEDQNIWVSQFFSSIFSGSNWCNRPPWSSWCTRCSGKYIKTSVWLTVRKKDISLILYFPRQLSEILDRDPASFARQLQFRKLLYLFSYCLFQGPPGLRGSPGPDGTPGRKVTFLRFVFISSDKWNQILLFLFECNSGWPLVLYARSCTHLKHCLVIGRKTTTCADRQNSSDPLDKNPVSAKYI